MIRKLFNPPVVLSNPPEVRLVLGVAQDRLGLGNRFQGLDLLCASSDLSVELQNKLQQVWSPLAEDLESRLKVLLVSAPMFKMVELVL